MSAPSDARVLQHRLCGFGLLLVFVGGAGMFGLEVAKRRIAKTAQWPSVRGKIVKSEVVTTAVKNGRALIVSPHAETVYTFTVGGRNYRGEGRRIVPMLHFETEGSPEQIVAKYRVGSSVTVFYNPADPSDALLTPVPDESAQSLISALTLIAPLIGGVGLLVAGNAGLKLWRTRDLAPKVVATPAVVAAPVFVQAPKLVEPPCPAKPPRTTHWIVRAIATIFGLALFWFGTLVTLTTLRIDSPAVTGSVQTVMIGIFAGVTILGSILICVGMRRPRKAAQSA